MTISSSIKIKSNYETHEGKSANPVLSLSIHKQIKKQTMTTQNPGIQHHLSTAELCINHHINKSELVIVQKKIIQAVEHTARKFRFKQISILA